MSRALTTEDVLEGLQKIIHDLHDLSARDHSQVVGVVVTVPVQYRAISLSNWKVTIEPFTGWESPEGAPTEAPDAPVE